MTARIIHATDPAVPALSLPPGALAHTDREYDYDVERDPPNVEPIEHPLRLDFMRGGPIRDTQLLDGYNPWTYVLDEPVTHPWRHGRDKPQGFAFAEASCAARIRDEATFYDNADDAALEDAPAFFAARIREARDDDEPQRALAAERKRRTKWYRKLIPGDNLCRILQRSSYGTLIQDCTDPTDPDQLLEHNAYVGTVIVEDDTDPESFANDRGLDPEHVIHETDLSHTDRDDPVTLADYGIERPVPLLVGDYGTHSRYPLIPWGDVVTCSCPYKQTAPHRVMCKHELLATAICGQHDSIYLPLTDGIQVPHRARRFVSPEIAVTHHPQITGEAE